MNYKIQYKDGHFEVYDFWGNFLFSADNEKEIADELSGPAAA